MWSVSTNELFKNEDSFYKSPDQMCHSWQIYTQNIKIHKFQQHLEYQNKITHSVLLNHRKKQLLMCCFFKISVIGKATKDLFKIRRGGKWSSYSHPNNVMKTCYGLTSYTRKHAILSVSQHSFPGSHTRLHLFLNSTCKTACLSWKTGLFLLSNCEFKLPSLKLLYWSRVCQFDQYM